MDGCDRTPLEFQALVGTFFGDVPVQTLLYIYDSTVGGTLFFIGRVQFVYGSFLSALGLLVFPAGFFVN